MKKLLSLIKQRWFISLLGILALDLFIWFLGPLFGFGDFEPLVSQSSRLILIAFILVFWVAIRFRIYIQHQKQVETIIAALPVPSADEQATQEELHVLKERFQEALKMLKKTFSGGLFGQQFLYQLPWYIVIGPPGAGKTTLLKNSDLNFPLSDRFGKEAIRGIGGTRNCDWWFADEAILLDTAGRYTTQDSYKKVDQAAWIGFLDLLKKNRARRPINGAIIAVSLKDLLESNKVEQQTQAIAIRQRIEELNEHFDIRLPVYILFTKCDLLAGFMEFFDNLDRDKRSQVWGMSFKLEENNTRNALSQFSKEFELLVEQLQNQLMSKLENEKARERRNLIYTFPQQFSSLNELIQSFLVEIFQSNRVDKVLFRGVYFTSATQEGSPIDRIMGALANSFGLDRQVFATLPHQGKSFFINRLLHDVIFSESGLAGVNLKLEQKRAWLQRTALILIGSVTLWISGVWVTSFAKNKTYIEDVAKQTASIQKEINKLDLHQNNPLSLLPVLDAVRHLPGGYSDQQKATPWPLDFGLYQGDKLGKSAVSLYRKLLNELFLSSLMIHMEQQIQSHTDDTDYLRQGLVIYSMLDEPKHYDKDAIRNWFSDNLPAEITDEQKQSFSDHLMTLLEAHFLSLPRPLNSTLINQIQDLLKNTPNAE